MVYTLVAPALRAAMRQLCRRARVHYCDLLGHPIDSISRVAGVAARMEPGARAPLDQTYFKRIEAIEFAVRYDDGVGSGLDEADIVLVGVSRTSKTPLSIYLGYLGHKAANVPIVKGVEPPRALFEIDRAKIVGLTIDPERLAEIREQRVRSMGAPAPTLRRPRRRLRGARHGVPRPPAPAVPRDRRVGAVRRGDRDADHPARQRAGAAPRGGVAVSGPNDKYGAPRPRDPPRPHREGLGPRRGTGRCGWARWAWRWWSSTSS